MNRRWSERTRRAVRRWRAPSRPRSAWGEGDTPLADDRVDTILTIRTRDTLRRESARDAPARLLDQTRSLRSLEPRIGAGLTVGTRRTECSRRGGGDLWKTREATSPTTSPCVLPGCSDGGGRAAGGLTPAGCSRRAIPRDRTDRLGTTTVSHGVESRTRIPADDIHRPSHINASCSSPAGWCSRSGTRRLAPAPVAGGAARRRRTRCNSS